MKKTEYSVMTAGGMSGANIYKRVYKDENGKRFIRENRQYVCIENKPCINFMIKD